MPASVFELLFKYRPVVFERGHLVFSAPRIVSLVVLVLAAAGVVILWRYRTVGGRASFRTRVGLLILRAAVLALVLVALLRPALLVSTAVPERNVVGILLDDSQSMQIADDGAIPRAEQLRQLFGGATAPIPAALAERFQLRFYRFSRVAERTTSPDALEHSGGRSDLATALDDVRRDLAALPLAGLVLVSDGADNADSSVTRALLALTAAEIPVYTVGIGADRLRRDLELVRVEAPRVALQGSSVVVEALVRQSGPARDSLELVVEESGQRLAAQRFAPPGDGQATTLRVPVALPASGGRELVVRVPALADETITRNNERRIFVSVLDRTEEVLYFEGEPRFEFAFLRRAVSGDTNLRVVGLQRTAEGKYLRLGVRDSLDLIGGFPRGRAELFKYRALVLGSVEAAAFTAEQLRSISDFVGRRGGGLLLLGGRRAFAEGGYRDTPLEDVFPVALDAPGDSSWFRVLDLALTPAGRAHPVTRIGNGTDAAWDSMPPLTAVNRLGRLKPGATALVMGRDTANRGEQVAFAVQRFGRGKAAALMVQDVWRWKMNPEAAPDDRRFETFWRQTLRWLVNDTPDQVALTVQSDQVAPGEPITLLAEVRDEAFLGASAAQVTAEVTSPSGQVSEVAMDWVVGTEGQYRTAVPTLEPGQYQFVARATIGEDLLVGEPTFARAGDVGREFFGAEARPDLLRRISQETGGKFYPAGAASELPKDIVYTERGITRTDRLDLWDMPIVFLLVAGLLTAEWGLRRSRGLA
jgi:uncharacterized membrane protein